MKYYTCKICNKVVSQINAHLKKSHSISPQDYYDTYILKNKLPICLYCNTNTPNFISINYGYRQYCCKDCARRAALQNTLTKYDVENLSQVPSIAAKMKQSIKANWDSLNKEQYMQRCANISKGTKHAMVVPNVILKDSKDKFSIEFDCTSYADLIQHYGSGWYQSKDNTQVQLVKENTLKYKGKYFLKNSAIYDVIEKYITSPKSTYSMSYQEQAIFEYISIICSKHSYNVVQHNRSMIYPYELDIVVPSLNLAFEYNGMYWHNADIVGRNYHKDKSMLCIRKDIQLVHIYEWEYINDKDKLYNYLKHTIELAHYNKSNVHNKLQHYSIVEIYNTTLINDFITQYHYNYISLYNNNTTKHYGVYDSYNELIHIFRLNMYENNIVLQYSISNTSYIYTNLFDIVISYIRTTFKNKDIQYIVNLDKDYIICSNISNLNSTPVLVEQYSYNIYIAGYMCVQI